MPQVPAPAEHAEGRVIHVSSVFASAGIHFTSFATRRPGVRIPSRPPDFKGLTLFLKTGWSSFCQVASAPGFPSDCSSVL
jgi:hypothetical protein